MQVNVVAYPLVMQKGHIEVPDGLTENEIVDFILENRVEIVYKSPEFNYSDCAIFIDSDDD